MNIYLDFRSQIVKILEDLKYDGTLADDVSFSGIIVEPPRDRSNGELSTNAAMVVAKGTKQNPFVIAEYISRVLTLNEKVSSIEVVKPGFLNFSLKPSVWLDILANAFELGDEFGSSDLGQGKKINIEYVSANPTGPLHVGHTRGAVFGDSLANLLEFTGFKVTREYYINDAGTQIDALARSVYLRYLELHGRAIEFGDNVYPGEYLIDVAKDLNFLVKDSLLNASEDEWMPKVRNFATVSMLELIQSDLELLGVKMDNYYSEKHLYSSGKIEEAIGLLDSKGLIYEGTLPAPKGKIIQDYEARNQLLFKSTLFGDDVDRPIKKSDGGWTYFAPDVAYHFDKIERGFDGLIDVFGADHSGYVKRMKAAVNALSDGRVNLDIKLCQLVRLYKDGSPYKMSKREGNFVTLSDMISEVGKDVVRFLMLTRKNDAQLDFDFDKALEQSKDNTVFYVQYAHARCSSIIKKSTEMGLDLASLKLRDVDLSILTELSENKLIAKISEWPRLIELSSASHEPHRIVFYLYELAADMHSFQHEGKLHSSLRVLSDDRNKMIARLILVTVVRNVIRAGLTILGVSPLTKM
ncbi:arginine--tRNA ligase [Rhodobacteraceae bacterium]|nr:arginine--tRNA ligase [Paracoccaceae bacterium]